MQARRFTSLRLRGMVAFDSVDALVAGIAADVDQARALLGPDGAEPADAHAG